MDQPNSDTAVSRFDSARTRFGPRLTGVVLALLAEAVLVLAVLSLGLIEQKIADLAAMQRVLGELVQQCDVRDGHTTCPIIDVLAKY